MICLLTCIIMIFTVAACGDGEKSPSLTIDSSTETTITLNQTYRLDYTVLDAADGVTVTVSREGGGTGGSYNSESKLFSASATGVYTLTVTAKNGIKTAVKAVTVTVAAEAMTIAEYTTALSADEYTSSDLTGNYGLSDALNVGVNAQETEEIRYPVDLDSTFESQAVINFESFAGSFENDSAKLDAVITAAKTINAGGKKVKIKLPDRTIEINADYAGNYVGGSSAVTFDGFDGLHIEGGIYTLLLIDTPTVWKKAVSFSSCKELYVQNLAIDYKISPTIKGTVTSVDTENLTITYQIPASFAETVEKLNSVSALGGTLYSVIDYDKYTLAPRERGYTMISGDGFFQSFTLSGSGEGITAQLVLKEGYSSQLTAPRTGELATFAFAMYSNNGISITEGKDLHFEGVSVHSCPGMAFTASNSEGLYVNRFHMTLTRDRLMTATADGFHLSSMTGDVSITNSIMENSHDDALNIKAGYYYTVTEADSTNRVLTLSRRTSNNPMPRENDIIEVYKRDTFELIGKLTVVSATGNNLTQVVTVKERLSGIDWVNNVSTNISYVPKFTFANNIIRNKRNRGILVQVPDAIIENNTFKNVGHGSIQVASSMDVYNEATLPQNITVRNNKFINNGYLRLGSLYGDIAVFALGSAAVAPKNTLYGANVNNNYIENSGRAGIAFYGVGNSQINNNLFYNTGRSSEGTDTECAVALQNASGISLSGNYNYYTLESETWGGIITTGLTKREEITLTNNTRLTYKEEGGEAPEFTVSKTSASITVDGNLDEWQNIGHSVQMVGSSLSTGDQIDPSAYADQFGVEMSKITWSDTGIYLAFKIRDDKAMYKSQNDFWNGDCIEILMSEVLDTPSADLQLIRNEGDVAQMVFVPTWGFMFAASRTSDSILANKSLAEAVCISVSGGYQAEAYLPFTLLPNVKKAIDEGRGIAIAFVFGDGDRDDISRKRLQVSNVPHFVENYKTKTARMPRFIFAE